LYSNRTAEDWELNTFGTDRDLFDKDGV